MLKMGRDGVIVGHDRPTIGRGVDCWITERDHRLDGQDFPATYLRAGPHSTEIGNLWRFVNGSADAMAAELADNTVPPRADHGLDGGADIADPVVSGRRRDRLYGRHQPPAGQKFRHAPSRLYVSHGNSSYPTF